MHKIRLLSVGKVKTKWIREGCDVYTERLAHSCDFSERVLSSGTQKEENDRILKALDSIDDVSVILDERGMDFTSREFAIWIEKKQDEGRPVTFVLGGAYGLDDTVRSRGTLLRLSRMTLPHELCKLIFLEQLFRAQSIMRNTGYHH